MEIINARSVGPETGSLTIPAGPPGLGKSWFAGTVAEHVGGEHVIVIATLPREINSVQYQKYDVDGVICTDEEWSPEVKVLKATGYADLMKFLRDLRTDEHYKAVILDNGTEAAELAWHAAMAPLGVGDPNDLGRGSNRFAPYTSLRDKMENLIRSLSILTGKTGLVTQPKLVIVPWHVQPPKDTTDDSDSADAKGQGSEYEGEYLPMIRGAFRRRLMALVDNYIYTDIQQVPADAKKPLGKMENHYCLQVVSDRERHVKIEGGFPDADKLVKGKFLDVHNRDDAFSYFMNSINRGT